MNLAPGARLGPYEIAGRLGAGGMGVVYRARDTRLGRDVALKFLPQGFAEDPERHARFEREAKLLAALNHPNIAVLYGLEHLDGQHALAMELVEGEGLEERIARGAVPLEEAVPIARQVADALEAAHEKGIVHRDLKPANVKVRPDGTVKVLDFGLAKAWDEQTSSSDLAFSPTITGHHTRAGVILGTAAYMSPEQARGKAVDKRADIWAFGCVVYEMLTGRRLFEGETVSDVLAAILRAEPDWSLLPSDVPRPIRRLLARALQRDPRQRLRDIGDVRLELDEVARGETAAETIPASGPPPVAHATARAWLPWTVAVLGAALGVGLTLNSMRSRSSGMPTVRAYLLPPEGATFAFDGATGGAVISPDGRRLAFVAGGAASPRRLWVRSLDSLTAQPLEGTSGASYPFWSPDSRFLGFFAQGKLEKIDTFGGPSQVICATGEGRGGTWGPEGVIVFAPAVSSGLQRVPSAGGTPTDVTRLDRAHGQTSHRWPVFLPDGRHFLFWAGSPESAAQTTSGIYVASLAGGEPRFVVHADSDALYAPPGFLLYILDQTLMARPFDAGRQELTGEALPVAELVSNPESYRLGRFTVSQDGTLVYLAGQPVRGQVSWLSANGAEVGTVGEPASIIGSIRLSPNGQILAEPVQDPQSKNVDIWLVDLARGVRTRFTFEPTEDDSPVWSPDGSRIVWSSNAKGNLDLYVKSSSGAGDGEMLFASDSDKAATDWSRDGRFITFTQLGVTGHTGADLWILPMSGDRKPYPLLATRFDEGNGMFSPDGGWLAYESDESGTIEVYITPFPQASGKWQVSQGGGEAPSWRSDGRALYYATPDGRLMEASVTARGSAVEVGTPHEFSKAQITGFGSHNWDYAVVPKGDRVLAVRSVQTAPTPLTLVTNWSAGLRR
ncbi:MAG TPA: protein kinase [Thermoanaerobaculaceae bacterium]|nr:protein kinase [Thermoanaerobaculaceae bacterium]